MVICEGVVKEWVATGVLGEGSSHEEGGMGAGRGHRGRGVDVQGKEGVTRGWESRPRMDLQPCINYD